MSPEAIITSLLEKQRSIQASILSFIPKGSDSYVELALLKAALHVCKCVLNERAVLFPTVHKYCSHLPASLSLSVHVSKARLLSCVSQQFGCLISSVCFHRKIGFTALILIPMYYYLLPCLINQSYLKQCHPYRQRL